MKQGLSLRVSQHLALTPQLQQSIRLLQLSTLELSQEVEQMLDENPFLELSQEEKELYREQLSAILDYAARLQALDTSGISPTSSVLPPHNVLRKDQARPGLSLPELLRNAPQTEGRQFRVPPVLE